MTTIANQQTNGFDINTARTTAANKTSRDRQVIQPYNKTDSQFYNSLQVYRPLCYTGKGSPLFLINQGWYLSLGCMLVLNSIFLLMIFLFLKRAQQGIRPLQPQIVKRFTIIDWTVVGVMNFLYIMTQFLNPGIRNLSRISEQQYRKDGRFFCSRCNGDRTSKMEHCIDCDVCIYGLDHHCGFFGKCIGGTQKYFFFAFLIVVLIGFFALIWTAMSSTGM